MRFTLFLTATFLLPPTVFSSPIIIANEPAGRLLSPRQDICTAFQCSPFPQPVGASMRCSDTTSCVPTAQSGRLYCACRGGYRATTGARPGDTSVQLRINGIGQDGRVFVAAGATCDTLCDNPFLGPGSCAEVGLRNECA